MANEPSNGADFTGPLVHGQWRWVKFLTDSPWHPVLVTTAFNDEGSPEFVLVDTRWRPEHVYKIGPVAQPPEEKGDNHGE